MKSVIRFGVFAAICISMLVPVLHSEAQATDEWTDEERASGIKKEEFVRYAFAGNTMELMFLVALEIDCSVDEAWAYEIIKQPEHGVATLKPHTGFTYFPKSNPRHKCNETRVDGQMLTYKPDTGYKGPDTLTYVAINPSGMAYERTYRFNVRALPAATLKKRGA